MRYKYFIITIFYLTVSFFSTYILLFYFQLGANMKYYGWAKMFHTLKDNRVKEIGDDKKIIIVSGSGSHYSINSKKIQKKFNMPVVNLAYWIDNDLTFYYYQLKDIVKEGDVVIMPLEFPYYYRNTMTTRFTHEMMVRGESIYIDKLDIIDLGHFILNTEPKRIIKGVIHKIDIAKITKNYSTSISSNQIDKISINLFENETIDRGMHKINKYGDRIVSFPTKEIKKISYIKNEKISNYFVNKFNKINRLIENKKATLYLVYPVTMNNELFDLKMPQHQNKILSFEKNLYDNNIKISCNAGLSHLDKRYFADSPNHLLKEGREIRTENLIDCLDSLIQKKKLITSFSEALSKTEKLQKRNGKVDHLINFKIRYDHLKSIKQSLERYHADNGFYPKSKGFDGRYTKWGYSGKDWIKGLVPKYLVSLPVDPRNTKELNKQYLYKSNGKDFKLISHSTADYYVVGKKHPNMIDPKRKSAYGFWTEGAKSW